MAPDVSYTDDGRTVINYHISLPPDFKNQGYEEFFFARLQIC